MADKIQYGAEYSTNSDSDSDIKSKRHPLNDAPLQKVDLKILKMALALPVDVIRKLDKLEQLRRTGENEKIENPSYSTITSKRKFRIAYRCLPFTRIHKLENKEPRENMNKNRTVVKNSLKFGSTSVIELRKSKCLPIESLQWTSLMPRKSTKAQEVMSDSTVTSKRKFKKADKCLPFTTIHKLENKEQIAKLNKNRTVVKKSSQYGSTSVIELRKAKCLPIECIQWTSIMPRKSNKAQEVLSDSTITSKRKFKKAGRCLPFTTIHKLENKAQIAKLNKNRTVVEKCSQYGSTSAIELRKAKCLPIESIQWTSIIPEKYYKAQKVLKQNEIALPFEVVRKLEKLDVSLEYASGKGDDEKRLSNAGSIHTKENVLEFESNINEQLEQSTAFSLKKRPGKENIHSKTLSKQFKEQDKSYSYKSTLYGEKMEILDEELQIRQEEEYICYEKKETKPKEAKKEDFEDLTTIPDDRSISHSDMVTEDTGINCTLLTPTVILEDFLIKLKRRGFDVTEEQIRELGDLSSIDAENNMVVPGEPTTDLMSLQLQRTNYDTAQEEFRENIMEEYGSYKTVTHTSSISDSSNDEEDNIKIERVSHTEPKIKFEADTTEEAPHAFHDDFFPVWKMVEIATKPWYAVSEKLFGSAGYNETVHADLVASIKGDTIATNRPSKLSKKKSIISSMCYPDNAPGLRKRESPPLLLPMGSRKKAQKGTQTVDEFIIEEQIPQNIPVKLLKMCGFLDYLVNPKNEEDILKNPEEKDVKFARTGFMSDGIRRIDYVLVMKKGEDSKEVEQIKLEFFVGLVKLGIEIEVVEGTLPQHQDLYFVLLHGTEPCLVTYAQSLGVRKYFTRTHESVIKFRRWSIIDHLFRQKHERELLKLLRAENTTVLKLSTLERSYIVRIILHYKSFGLPENYCSLKTLMNNKIILADYALHDGPSRPFPGQTAAFNNRQILFMTWHEFPNVLKEQPSHLIYEYFGCKIAFFFIFYEYYNKALFIASLWGLFMTVMYLIKDSNYLWHLRDFVCTRADVRDEDHLRTLTKRGFRDLEYRSVVCAECEGSSEKHVCPYTLIQDYCFDLHLMKFLDNPYIIWYSLGMSFFALYFHTQWQRIEGYYAWMWEEPDIPLPNARRTRGTLAERIRHYLLVGLVYFASHVVVPFLAILYTTSVIMFMFAFMYGVTINTSSSEVHLSIQSREMNVVPPKINKLNQYLMLLVTGLSINMHIFTVGKIYCRISYALTKLENHQFQSAFQQAVVHQWFPFPFFFTTALIITFAWIKGAFYYTPVHGWYLAFNVTLFSRNLSFNLSESLPLSLHTLLRRALTLNCGPFNCLRQGGIIFVVTVFVRAFLPGFVHCLCRRLHSLRKKVPEDVPTVEKEYLLSPVSETSVLFDFNYLFVQIALVLMFAPLFPLAPLLALIVNLWDIRSKADFYVHHARRPVLFRICNPWRRVFGFVCYIAPLCHAITIARTEYFKRYLFYDHSSGIVQTPDEVYDPQTMYQLRNYSNWAVEEAFINFMLFYNFFLNTTAANHHGFRDVNRKRVHLTEEPPNVAYGAERDGVAEVVHLASCRVNGFLQNLAGRDSYPWPFQWDFLEDNTTLVTPEPRHYQLLFYKVFFILVYVILFLCLSVLVRRYMGAHWPAVYRQRWRELALRRLADAQTRFLNTVPKDAGRRPHKKNQPRVKYRIVK